MDGQFFVALAVPLIGLFGSLLTSNREPGAYRRLKHTADALAAVDAKSPAVEPLRSLIAVQAQQLEARERARAARKLNVPNLVFSIILACAGGIGSFWLWNWSASVWGMPIAWVVIPFVGVLGLFVVLFVAAAFSTLYNPSTRSRDKQRN